MSDANLRARSTSEIVDAAFALYRRNAMQYIVVTALATAPQVILTLLIQGGTTPAAPGDLLKLLPVYLLSLVTFQLVSGVIIRMGSDVYLGGEADVARTVKDVLPRVPALIGGTLMLGLIAIISLVLFIFPVFYVLASFFAVSSVIVLENKGATQAFGRSSTLANGHKWSILGTLLLVFLIYVVLSLGITLLGTIFGGPLLVLLLSSLFSVVVSPIVHLVYMVLYYDKRIRVEGFDVEHMSRGLGASHAPSNAVPAV
ncbi:MAG: hypothetical protein ABJB66_20575 [Gemmatimonadaceae bacterium]